MTYTIMTDSKNEQPPMEAPMFPFERGPREQGYTMTFLREAEEYAQENGQYATFEKAYNAARFEHGIRSSVELALIRCNLFTPFMLTPWKN